MSPKLANAVLFLDAEPLVLALVGARAVQFDHFSMVVGCFSSSFLECFLEDCAAVCAFQVEGCLRQDSRASGIPIVNGS